MRSPNSSKSSCEPLVLSRASCVPKRRCAGPAVRLAHLAEERQHAAPVGEVHAVAEPRITCIPSGAPPVSKHGLGSPRAVPHALRTRGRRAPGRREREEQALALFAAVEVDREARAPLLELACLVGKQHVAARLDGESHGMHVGEARAELCPGTGFGVAGIRKTAEFEAAVSAEPFANAKLRLPSSTSRTREVSAATPGRNSRSADCIRTRKASAFIARSIRPTDMSSRREPIASMVMEMSVSASPLSSASAALPRPKPSEPQTVSPATGSQCT